MRVFLSGQKYFGQEVLKLLLMMNIEIAGVSAPPHKQDGRNDRLWVAATRLGLPLIRAGRLNASTLPEGVDLIICAHSHDFIGAKTRQRVKLGGVGFHPSLLPLHRGRDAIYWTVKMGDRVTGGTVYWLNDKVDGGPIAAQDWCFVPPGIKPLELWVEKLQPLGLRLLQTTVNDLLNGRFVSIPQDERISTWEPSVGRPPLFKPDLPQIGPPPEGYEVITTRSGMRRALDLYAGEG